MTVAMLAPNGSKPKYYAVATQQQTHLQICRQLLVPTSSPEM
jgi:hypothetical protein